MRPIPQSSLSSGDTPRRRGRAAGNPVRARRSRLVPVLAVALCATTAWAGATSYYIVFRDEMLGRFFGQVRAVQLAYEERVGALQSQVDRTTAERIRSREGFEGRLDALAERQATIEKRQGMLADLGATEPETTGSIAGPAPSAQPQKPRKPFPTPETTDPAGALGLRMHGGDRVEAPERRLDRSIAGLEGRLGRIVERQSRALDEAAAKSARSAERYRSAILRAGLDPNRFDRTERAVGGPLIPVRGDAFDLALAEARRSSEDEQRLRRTVAALPFRKPLAEESVQTSAFGTRLDPFTRGLALHTGVDMRADHGTPARATAAGRVTVAEYGGGYGNMVELDHGQGVVTRYAHLASYAVAPGQRVEAGAAVGRVGSTGRSTGNHLHYEVRVDGQPVDPERFLKASGVLAGESTDAVPDPSGEDGLSTESWIAWSKAQLQKLARRG